MKKLLFPVLLAGLLCVLWAVPALAASATVDTANAAKGYVTVNLSDFQGSRVVALVQKDEDRYQYSLIKAASNLPLQMGTGSYSVVVGEVVSGNKLMPFANETLDAAAIDEKAMYTISNPMIEYSVSTKAIPAYEDITEGLTADKEKAEAVHGSIVGTFTYDNDLAAQVTAGQVTSYVPVIDTVFGAKKAICYGFSAVLGGALRSQGIPTRMVHGYPPELPEVFHAWNEVLIDGKWLAVDATFDQALAADGQPVVMVRDRSKAKVTKVY